MGIQAHTHTRTDETRWLFIQIHCMKQCDWPTLRIGAPLSNTATIPIFKKQKKPNVLQNKAQLLPFRGIVYGKKWCCWTLHENQIENTEWKRDYRRLVLRCLLGISYLFSSVCPQNERILFLFESRHPGYLCDVEDQCQKLKEVFLGVGGAVRSLAPRFDSQCSCSVRFTFAAAHVTLDCNCLSL